MASKEVNTSLNTAGAQPFFIVHGESSVLEQARDGSSDMFDFALT